jgi:uncharacterized protein (DUF427 family)
VSPDTVPEVSRPDPDDPDSRPAESVDRYPRPPRLDRVPWRIRVELGGETVAETTRALRVCETFGAPTYYIPPEDVRTDLLEQAPGGSSFCEWKGRARYWTVEAGGRTAERAAWSYPDPTPSFRPLRDHLAFYVGKMDACWVDGDRAEPQPGGFYGGWVTPEISGPIKGAPGTRGW